MAALQDLGIIFDIDGTLVDSNAAHARSWQQALESEELRLPLGSISRLIGMGADKLLPTLAGLSADQEPGKRIARKQGEIFQTDYLSSLRPFPGAIELVRRMIGPERLRVAIATSGQRGNLKKILAVTGLDEVFERKLADGSEIPWITHDEVNASKPSPEPIDRALAKLGLPPEKVWMIGDTPYDIRSARDATVGRVRAIGFTCGGWDPAGLQGALAVYAGPADLLANWSTSPLARDIAVLNERERRRRVA